MTLKQYLWEGGSNGTALSSANTGGGTPNVDSGGSATFTDATPYQGSLSARFSYPASGVAGVWQPLTPTATDPLLSSTVAFRVNNALTGNTAITLAQFRTTSGPLYTVRGVVVSGTMTAHFFAGTTDLGNLGTITTGNPGPWYRASLVVNGTTGAYTVRMYDASDTLINTLSGTNAGLVGTITTLRVGQLSVLAQAVVVDIDYACMDDGSSTELGAPSNVPPVVDAGINQNVAAGTVNLTGTATDPDGSIASVAWDFFHPTSGAPSLTGGTTLTPSFTAGSAPQLYIPRLTATDNLGGTTSDTVEIRVPAAGSATVTPVAMAASKVGTWTRIGGSTDGGALGDASDAIYMESGTLTSTEQSVRTRVNPTNARASGILTVRLATDTGSGTAVIRLIEGSTTRESWTRPITSTPTDYALTLAGGTISAISDWGNLSVEVGVTT